MIMWNVIEGDLRIRLHQTHRIGLEVNSITRIPLILRSTHKNKSYKSLSENHVPKDNIPN